ncbi:MAG: hypothetical protein WDA74_09390 [Spirochaetota bacterium]
MIKKLSSIATLFIILIFASSAFAQSGAASGLKFDPYISVRAFLGYHYMDEAGKSSETELVHRLQANTRIGTKMEVAGVKAHVEIGLNTNAQGDPAYLRLAYATYNFQDFQIMVGQNYTPYFFPATGDYIDDNGLGSFGHASDGRNHQIMLSWKGAYLSLIETKKSTGAETVADTTVIFPKVALGHDYKFGAGMVGFGGAYNTIKIDDASKAYDGKYLNSWITYLRFNLAVEDFVLRGSAMYGFNTGNFGLDARPAANADSIGVNMPTSAVAVGGKFKDSKHFMGYINPMYKLSPSILIGLGAGYAQVDNSEYAKTDRQVAYFVNMKYDINKYFHIAPEFVYRDFMKDENGAKQGSEFYAGAKVQLDVF